MVRQQGLLELHRSHSIPSALRQKWFFVYTEDPVGKAWESWGWMMFYGGAVIGLLSYIACAFWITPRNVFTAVVLPGGMATLSLILYLFEWEKKNQSDRGDFYKTLLAFSSYTDTSLESLSVLGLAQMSERAEEWLVCFSIDLLRAEADMEKVGGSQASLWSVMEAEKNERQKKLDQFYHLVSERLELVYKPLSYFADSAKRSPQLSAYLEKSAEEETTTLQEQEEW